MTATINYDSERFIKAQLSELPLCEIYGINDVNEKIDYFNQLFINTLDKHAPIKHTRIIKENLTNLSIKI
jgi:hypothetical protein